MGWEAKKRYSDMKEGLKVRRTSVNLRNRDQAIEVGACELGGEMRMEMRQGPNLQGCVGYFKDSEQYPKGNRKPLKSYQAGVWHDQI